MIDRWAPETRYEAPELEDRLSDSWHRTMVGRKPRSHSKGGCRPAKDMIAEFPERWCDDRTELVLAVDKYRRDHDLIHVPTSRIFDIIMALGYRKTEGNEAAA